MITIEITGPRGQGKGVLLEVIKNLLEREHAVTYIRESSSLARCEQQDYYLLVDVDIVRLDRINNYLLSCKQPSQE